LKIGNPDPLPVSSTSAASIMANNRSQTARKSCAGAVEAATGTSSVSENEGCIQASQFLY